MGYRKWEGVSDKKVRGGGGLEKWARKSEVIFYISNLNNGSPWNPFSVSVCIVFWLLLVLALSKKILTKIR